LSFYLNFLQRYTAAAGVFLGVGPEWAAPRTYRGRALGQLPLALECGLRSRLKWERPHFVVLRMCGAQDVLWMRPLRGLASSRTQASANTYRDTRMSQQWGRICARRARCARRKAHRAFTHKKKEKKQNVM
jgi:hypothetical protein